MLQVKVPKVICSHGKPWAKNLTSVKPLAKNGYDYDGVWINQGELCYAEPGDVFICVGYSGSLKNGNATASFYVVGPNGKTIKFLYWDCKQWAMRACTEVANVLEMLKEQRIFYAAKECIQNYVDAQTDAEIVRWLENLSAGNIEDNPLAKFSDDEIRQEAIRRKLITE